MPVDSSLRIVKEVRDIEIGEVEGLTVDEAYGLIGPPLCHRFESMNNSFKSALWYDNPRKAD